MSVVADPKPAIKAELKPIEQDFSLHGSAGVQMKIRITGRFRHDG